MSDNDTTAESDASDWVAVRCIFRTEWDNERYSYEERITLWRTKSMDEAFARAEAEAFEYAAMLSTPPSSLTEYVHFAQAYSLSDAPSDGAEIFSLIRTSQLAPPDYLAAFFSTGTERQRTIDADGNVTHPPE